ncbi:uncharacterized protein LOC115028841 [Tachysurus ichikawai]
MQEKKSRNHQFITAHNGTCQRGIPYNSRKTHVPVSARLPVSPVWTRERSHDQVHKRPEDLPIIKKMAFNTSIIHYEYLVMPFSLTAGISEGHALHVCSVPQCLLQNHLLCWRNGCLKFAQQPFLVWTDHKNLKYLLSAKETAELLLQHIFCLQEQKSSSLTMDPNSPLSSGRISVSS